MSAEDLLSDSDLQSLLRSHNKTASEKVSDDPKLRLALLSRISVRAGRPVASDALGTLHTAEDMAAWFAKNLRPSGARPHARGIMRAAIGSENVEEVDMRIDLEGDRVEEEVLNSLPGNLQLDPNTFRKPDERLRKKARLKRHTMQQVREVKQAKAAKEAREATR